MNGFVARLIPLLFLISIVSGCANMGVEPEPQPSPATVETTPPAEPEIRREMVTVTASRLNLRAENTTKSKILSVLKKDESVSVLGRKSGWVNVQTESGKKGWVAERYTRPAVSMPTQAQVQQAPKASVTSEVPTAAAVPRTGTFSQKDAVALFNRYRKALSEGDFNAFVACVYEPPESAGEGPSFKDATQEDFTQFKDFLLEMTPDPAASKILRFDSNEEAALLVILSDLKNADYITLSALKFVSEKSRWKMFPKFYDNTFPRKDPQADKTAIAKELEVNPELQLAAVTPEAKTSTETPLEALPPGEVPSGTGQVQGELVINGVSSQLKYAYAYTEPGFFDKSKMDTVVILSNIALDDEAVNDWGRRADLEETRKLHCVELTINADGKVISRRLRHSAFKASPSGVSSDEVFEPQATGKGVIAGKAYTTKEDDFFGVTYQYRASFLAQIRPPTQMSPEEKAQPQQASVFNDSPEHQAIVKMLKAEGRKEILQTAHSVSMNSVENFARVGIVYQKGGQSSKADLYLFKENDTWVAYSKLPTHKDDPEIFSELAMQYCKSRYKNMMGLNFMDDSYESKDLKKRIININCGELINKEWQYHRLSMTYEYNAEKGWVITGAQPYRKPETQSKKTVSKKTKTKKKSAEKRPVTSLQEAMKISDLQIAIMLSGNQGEARALELVKSGADLSFKNKIGDTPLHTAVNTQPPSAKIVQALLAGGAKVDAPNEYGYTPLHNLAQNAVNTDAPVVALLIGAGADVNLKDPYGMTPLYHMTIHGLGCKGTKVAQVLIDAGADVNTRGKKGTTVLAAARKSNCDALAALLEKAGAR